MVPPETKLAAMPIAPALEAPKNNRVCILKIVPRAQLMVPKRK